MKTYKIEWAIIVHGSTFVKKGPRRIVDKYISSGAIIEETREERDEKRRITGFDEIISPELSDIPGRVLWKYCSLGADWHVRIFRQEKFTLIPDSDGSDTPITFACFEIQGVQ